MRRILCSYYPSVSFLISSLQSSFKLAETASEFSGSQYAAVLFTHDPSSILDDGDNTTFLTKSQRTCFSRSETYTSDVWCKRHGHIGYIIQYNYTALHASPLFQTLADEAIVRKATNKPDFKIQTTIDPFPITSVEADLGKAEDAFSAWFLIILSFPFISGAFATFIVNERQSKAKHLQTVAGVKPVAYWLSSYLWDTMNYQIPLWVTVVLMYIFDVDVLTTTNREVVQGVVTLLVLYGPASAGFTYCVSYAFTSSSLCNMFIIIFSFLIGMGGPLACFIMLLLGNEPGDRKPKLLLATKILTWILRFTPCFCLGKGIFNAINIDVYGFLEGDMAISAFSEPILLYEVCFMAAECIAFLGLAIVIDIYSNNPSALSVWETLVNIVTFKWVLVATKSGDRKLADISVALPDDEDVISEQERVVEGHAKEDLIVLSHLTKIYSNGKVAVNSMSLGIPPGECFGLLGINGAGKTTTMGMLTAEFPPTHGDATLAGFSVSHEPDKTRRRIGYCPQFDAHFDNLTGREHVELYASIKGVPLDSVKSAAAAKLEEVGLSEEDSDRLSSGYSGGMKRRLSLACATIGQPQIVFLDECSTGVDPVARREIWQLINDMVVGNESMRPDERTSVILTTHSMEECEALCPRIGIMATGRLRCLGSAQHLKNKFGQGYQIEMKVRLLDRQDGDYLVMVQTLEEMGAGRRMDGSEELSFDLEETLTSLTQIMDGSDELASLITEENPGGYVIWKDATSTAGVALSTLAAFATNEQRMTRVARFLEESYPSHVLRERQDNKVRYEVSSTGLRISSIFSTLESRKDELQLADYGVSQTSLEQVFNMHAAEAEKLKQGRNDA